MTALGTCHPDLMRPSLGHTGVEPNRKRLRNDLVAASLTPCPEQIGAQDTACPAEVPSGPPCSSKLCLG